MKYKCVRIFTESDNWKSNIIAYSEDRVDTETEPNPLGFYYYGEDVSDELAFERIEDYAC